MSMWACLTKATLNGAADMVPRGRTAPHSPDDAEDDLAAVLELESKMIADLEAAQKREADEEISDGDEEEGKTGYHEGRSNDRIAATNSRNRARRRRIHQHKERARRLARLRKRQKIKARALVVRRQQDAIAGVGMRGQPLSTTM